MGNNQYIGYVGTYTKKDSQGVYRFRFNADEKRIDQVEPVASLENPTYVTVSEDNQFLYAVSKEGDEGGVTAFQIGDDGELTKVNSQASAGSPPCHVSVRSDNRFVLTANFHTKQVEAYPVHQDGSVQAPHVVEHEGSGHMNAKKSHTYTMLVLLLMNSM
ncbi:6-phosphogluconolactonase [Gracilibacillus halophilus YIM-C55.5]|uniref:6-phosphogluconolactonase n=1 Tax=Gracilibacillus halophilus YIM-C55.5 TaxID=1308866 RepID=N4WA49_9BACI|nr:6-phosphogluconolactonase [Gracilibacillus halophilus YIM-C55.5]